MTKTFFVGQTEVTFSTNARRSWTELYRRPKSWVNNDGQQCYIWGCFALHLDREYFEREVEVCDCCGELTSFVGEDALSYCSEGGCGLVEGSTHHELEHVWYKNNA